MDRVGVLAALVLAQWLASGDPVFGQDPPSMTEEQEPAIAKITVVNLTKGQILTPAVFISHNDQAPALFVPGRAASSELAALAERGYTAGLVNKYNAEQGVLNVTTLSQFVRPTNTATVNVEFDAEHWLISSASMLEMTNDGFVSLLAVEVPCEGKDTYFVDGWDAGSEANSELCREIPAPCPVPARSGRCSVSGAEGAVHIHSGIHGCGGFPPEIYDWRHPVAMITIEAASELSPEGALDAACAGRLSAESSSNDESDDDGSTSGTDGAGSTDGSGGDGMTDGGTSPDGG